MPRVSFGAGVVRAALIAVPFVFVAVFFAWPVVVMLGRGFIADAAPVSVAGAAPGVFFAGLDLGGFAEVLGRPRTLRIIGFTVAQAAFATVVTVLVGVPLAYVLYRLRFRGQAFARAFVMVPFVLPTVTVGTAFQALLGPGGPWFGLGLDQSWWAVVLAIVFMNITVVTRTVGGAWQQLDPRPEFAAAALGASRARVWFTVTLPRLGPALRSAAVMVFLFCATAFGIVLILGGVRFGTVESEIYVLTTQFLDLRGAAVLSVVQLVLVVVLLLVSRRVVRSSASAQVHTVPVAARHTPVLMLGVLVIAFIATPIVSLLLRSLQGRDRAWSLQNYRDLVAPPQAGTTLVPVTEALSNSLRISVDATLLAVTLGVATAIILASRPRTRWGKRWLNAYDTFLMLPLGVSAVTLGFGLLLTMQHLPGDVRTSGLLVPVAQALVALPLVLRTLLPVMQGVPPARRAAAQVLGAGPWRTFVTVDLPVMWRPVLAAASLAFAIALGEFGATSFLARPGAPTLPVVIYTLLQRPDTFGVAVAGSVVLASVTMLLIGIVERLRSGTAGAF